MEARTRETEHDWVSERMSHDGERSRRSGLTAPTWLTTTHYGGLPETLGCTKCHGSTLYFAAPMSRERGGRQTYGAFQGGVELASSTLYGVLEQRARVEQWYRLGTETKRPPQVRDTNAQHPALHFTTLHCTTLQSTLNAPSNYRSSCLRCPRRPRCLLQARGNHTRSLRF